MTVLASFAQARAARNLLLCATLLFASTATGIAHDFKSGGVELEHPWARATPAGAKVAAGYVAITNHAAAPDRLVSASAEIAGRTEIHEMAVKDGIMTMRRLPDGLPVPANGKAALKPSSAHLMFLELKRPLKQGESFDGTLTFEKAGTVKVTFAVQAVGSTGADH